MLKQLSLFNEEEKQFVSLKVASEWASCYLNRKVTVSNISYLIQYGKIKKYKSNGSVVVNIKELKSYYDSLNNKNKWIETFGNDIDWHLSFAEYKESERTKHVHRLHPYKGKFIPQLVEYFLDSHTDEFKKEIYFREGDIVLDPFCGSGTTLVQANELGMHAIGVDISEFNSLLSNVKVRKHDLIRLANEIDRLTRMLKVFQEKRNNISFENELLSKLSYFNSKYFPSPDYKRKVAKKQIDEKVYSVEKETEFYKTFNELVEKYKIKLIQDKNNSFLDKWFLYPVREEIDFLAKEIKKIEPEELREVLTIILSRTVRSCRATTHEDLATLKEPVYKTYYCKKHGKICKPIFSISKWWEYYTEDTLKRITEFDKLRTNTYQICLTGDSRTLDIYNEIKKLNPDFAKLLKEQKISGIFSSPPYVGLIDYHEQHAYAYELFGFERRDEIEIGPLFKGQGEEQRKSYVQGIAEVLLNCKKYLKEDYNIFLVANDKFNLYPKIAELAEMQIVNTFKRPVLNRVEKDRDTPYSEIIFHLKEKIK